MAGRSQRKGGAMPDTYRDKIRAYRRMTTVLLRRDLDAIERGIELHQPLVVTGAVPANVTAQAREAAGNIKRAIDAIMYEPYPPHSDETAPDHWHPGGPHLDGTNLVRDWA